MAKGDVLVRMKADVSNYDANIAKARRQLESFKNDNLSISGALKQTQGALLATAARFASVTAAVGALGGAFMDNIATAQKFEKSMSQLSSLTGMVGDDLNKLKEYAIELGSSTTLSASEVADAFRMIGSQQPQLLSSGEALKAVTKNAITLAEAAGIDLATASQTLSTSINQMGGDSANAERYINVLAAAAQNGAGDIAWLGEAITKSGTTAKAVGTDYEELVANLEQLAKAGFDASTAGTALRSIIMNLEKQANNDFKPSVVGLTQAFENLGKANLDIVGYQEIAGKMFASQAKALADAAGEAKNMTAAITGTNTAEEQAKTNTDNLEGSIKSLSSAWEGFNLHLNSSNGIFRDIVDGLKDIVVWADKVIVKLGEVPNPEKAITNSLPEVGANVDDKGNYIKRPAQRGAVGFDWEKGAWMSGYTGAIYNSASGQTELPEITVTGTKKTTKLPKKDSSKSSKNQPEYLDFYKALFKNEGQNLKAEAPFQSVYGMLKPEDMLGKHEDWEEYKDTITGALGSIGDSFDNLTSFTKNFDPYQNFLDQQQEKLNGLKKGWQMAASAISMAGSAMSGLRDPAIDIMTVIGQAVATIGLAYADTLAKDNTSKSNIYAFIAAAAAATVSMATTIASLHSATGYSEGGMIKGNSYSGDNIMANGGMIGLNAGEVVLNSAQQRTLASNLQGDGSGGRIVGVLKGENMYLMVNRYTKRSGRGEIVTWGG